jgi:signal transduction histidine kinase
MQLEQLVDQRTAELTLANEELHQERQHLRDLLELYDRDRRLIGFEIHDGLTQLVAGAVMQWETALGNLRARGDEVPAAAGTGLSLARQALDESRRLIAGLHSDVLEQEGVVAAICDLIRRLATHGHGPRIEFHHHLGADRFPGPLENTMYRIVQETVNNACRHSQSDRVRIDLNQEGDRVRIEVEDWGKGFDPQSVGTGHYGLESISQRARLFGGDALIESHPGHGTRIVAQLPLLL